MMAMTKNMRAYLSMMNFWLMFHSWTRHDRPAPHSSRLTRKVSLEGSRFVACRIYRFLAGGFRECSN
jgi:hypothetical protein